MNKLYLLAVLLISTAVQASEPHKQRTREELRAALRAAKAAAHEKRYLGDTRRSGFVETDDINTVLEGSKGKKSFGVAAIKKGNK